MRARILVVDEERASLAHLRNILEGAGYEVAEALDGKEAMRQVPTFKPHVVVTALMTPEQDGLETIRLLRRDHANVGIVAISDAAGWLYLRAAQVFGAHATMLKPVNGMVLLDAVERLLTK